MKTVLFVVVSLFLSTSYAQTSSQTYDATKGAAVLPDIVLQTPKDVVRAEDSYESKASELDQKYADVQVRIAALSERQAELKAKIPEVKKDRDYYNKNDGCWNTLGKKEFNCTGPFSGNTEELKGNWSKARDLDKQYDSMKAERKGIERDLAALKRQESDLASQRTKLTSAQAKEQERLQREEEKREKQLASAQKQFELDMEKGRQSMIAAEESERKAEDAVRAREQKNNESRIRELNSKISRLSVKAAFSELKVADNEIDTALRLIQDQYDKSLMGVYMQKKIVTVLESDLLCKKVSECQSGKKTQVTQEEISKIFPGSPKLSTGSSSSSGSR